MIDIKAVPESVMNCMCKFLVEEITAYYQIPENQKRFEEKCLKKYGKLPTNASYMKKINNIDSTAKREN